jgi:hypothetical protein
MSNGSPFSPKDVTSAAPTLAAGDWTLRRAGRQDFAALVALQHAAYARNRELLGVEPIPLQADYRVVLAEREVRVLDGDAGLRAALILEPRSGELVIESIAAEPRPKARGSGGRCSPPPRRAPERSGMRHCGSTQERHSPI